MARQLPYSLGRQSPLRSAVAAVVAAEAEAAEGAAMVEVAEQQRFHFDLLHHLNLRNR